MDRRHFLSQLGLIGLGVGFAWVLSETFLNRHADRRFTLYSIRNELHKGMPRSEVEAIIGRHDTPFIMKHVTENSIRLSVRLGGHDYLYLMIEFLEEKLTKAYFAGEDNPWDVPKDAPSKLE
jgi:predicted acetyltransferase